VVDLCQHRAPQFVLSFDVQTAMPGRSDGGVTKAVSRRATTSGAVRDLFEKHVSGTDTYVKLEVGPPVGRPVQYRVSGPTSQVGICSSPASSEQPDLGNVIFDWMEPARVVKVDVLQDRRVSSA
jgi:hypothetical protein